VNTKQLRYFITVATEGSFTRASAKLRVAQPALSRQIALLEGELGAPLLIRHRRGVGLTDAGAALLDRARPVLLSLDCIQSEMMDYSAAPTGPLRIGCTPTLTSRLVVKPALRILERFPNVAMQIQEGVSHQLCRAVLADELDAAIVSENLAESFLAAEALFEEQVWFFGPPSKKAYRRKATLQQISRIPMILARSPQTTRRIIDHALAAAKLKIERRRRERLDPGHARVHHARHRPHSSALLRPHRRCAARPDVRVPDRAVLDPAVTRSPERPANKSSASGVPGVSRRGGHGFWP
jgi:DNA-binding transcriptional LysR family regulator